MKEEIPKIVLVPDLLHCIETVARREHEETLKLLIVHDKENKELQEKCEILRLFLETANFKRLRYESEKQLMESREVKFIVYLEDGAVKYKMQVIRSSYRFGENVLSSSYKRCDSR